jgi:hypothetical protein
MTTRTPHPTRSGHSITQGLWERWRRSTDGSYRSRRDAHDDEGLTLVELLVAFATLLVLFAIAGTALTTYLNAGNTVIATYNSADQFIPSQIIIARLIRSQVEPAPTPASGSTACSSAANVPCPAFLTGSVGTYSVTFYANVGGTAGQYGPAKIVMAEGTPTKCSNCTFYSSTFTVMEYPALQTPACPTLPTATNSCSWSTSGIELVDIPSVVNGAAPVASAVTACGATDTTPLCGAATPIFTYNTLDPYSGNYVPGAGGTPSSTGILPTFSSCTAPTFVSLVPTQSNCPADMIQSVGVDLEVQSPGSAVQENAYTVYRLSSASYLYSTLIG